ncbi:MAG: hypothetical protein ABW072_17500 [Sedimenticola sp.]
MLNIHRSLIIIFVFLITVSGCASFPGSLNMTCSSLKYRSITKPGKQFDLVDFSVRLPNDSDRWCIASSNIGSLILFTHPLMGKTLDKPTPSVALNSIGMMAMEIKHNNKPFHNALNLKSFVENWINQGFGVEGGKTNLSVMETKVKRFSLLKSDVKTTKNPFDVCVRYDYVMKEVDNTHAPNQILIIEDTGLVCQHQNLPSNLVLLGLSERYTEGGRIDPKIFGQLKEKIGPDFFNSLRF